MITKRQTVLNIASFQPFKGSGLVVFEKEFDDDDDLDCGEEIHITEDIYKQMGEPDVITVTIEYGDKLNPTYADKISGKRLD